MQGRTKQAGGQGGAGTPLGDTASVQSAGTLSEKDVSARLKPRSCVSSGTPAATPICHSLPASS